MSSYFKYFIVVLCAGVFSYLWIGSSGLEQKEPAIVVGLQSGYPPFELRNEAGQIVGFDVDLAELIAKSLSRKLVVKDMDFDNLILSLQQGKIDLILSGMNITPGRQKAIEMIPYTGEKATELTLIFWKKIPEGVQKLEDLQHLSNAIVSVEMGAIPEMYLQKFPALKVKSLHGAMEPLMDVKMGKSTANLVEPEVAQYLQSKYPELRILSVPMSEEDQILGFGIGIKKENQILKNEIDALIEQFKADGKLQRLEQKWFKGEKSWN